MIQINRKNQIQFYTYGNPTYIRRSETPHIRDSEIEWKNYIYILSCGKEWGVRGPQGQKDHSQNS